MTTRTEQLRDLMKQHGLKPGDVAQLLNRSETTVRIWLCASDNRNIPEHSLELLKVKVAAQ